MSEYLLQRYRPIADAILTTHELIVDNETRDKLAKTIMFNRVLPLEAVARKYTAGPALKKAKTHAEALLKHAIAPPTRPESIEIRSQRLAAALRDNELVGLELVLAKPSFNPLKLLVALDKGNAKPTELRRLVATLNTIQPGKVGRPRAGLTNVVRCGCIAWKSAGHEVQSNWNVDSETLSGALPDFLRDLIACCSGKHELIVSMERTRQNGTGIGLVRNKLGHKGDMLATRDMALRDAISAYRASCKLTSKNSDLSL